MVDLAEFLSVGTAATSCPAPEMSSADAARPWRNAVMKARQLNRQATSHRLNARCARQSADRRPSDPGLLLPSKAGAH